MIDQPEKERPEKQGFFKRVGSGIREFFLPSANVSTARRILPYGLLGVVTLLLITGGTYAWDYTNSPVFCGDTCHTMPPEYAAYQVSPHARVNCVECHIGRGFVAQRITRKAGDIRHVTSTLFTTYEYPIYADEMRPARETCEQCHYPAKFSDDSLREVVHFGNDQSNSRSSTFLAMRTGGGTERAGVGLGIHWHVESEVFFVATDDLEQDIPYVRVVQSDGTETEYVALDAPYSAEEYRAMTQERMDCITCHNRISHNIMPPEDAVARALERQQISEDIPYIRVNAVNVLQAGYESDEAAREAIQQLNDFYAEKFPEYYAENSDQVEEAVEVLTSIYGDIQFRDQDINWLTHPNNIGHKDWPGCFRCHDGQHVSGEGEAVRLECNLCHSIPEVASATTIEPVLPLATGNQPESHFSTHWIAQHRFAFDQTCQACHTVENPGGTDNTSFCSNSACHGTAWEYAGLNAPGLSDLIQAQMPAPEEPQIAEAEAGEEMAEATEEPAAGEAEGEEAPAPEEATWDDGVGALFEARCTQCHSEGIATGQLVLASYNAAMRGGADGPVILPGDSEDSLLVEVQSGNHFGQFTDEELEVIIDWIDRGAPLN